MHARKAKPVKNYDQVHITNLEDDFEELNLGLDERPTSFKRGFQIKNNNFGKSISPQTASKQSGGKKIPDSKVDDLNGFDKQSNNGLILESADKDSKDSFSSKSSYSPISRSGNTKTATQLKPWEKNNEILSTQTQPVSASILATSGTSMASKLRTNESPLLTARGGVMTTPLNQRAPVSSVQVTRRKKANPNEKGFGHDEQDMYIDDIEDF